MINAYHVIAFFLGAFIGRYLEYFIDILKKAKNDIKKVQEGKTRWQT